MANTEKTYLGTEYDFEFLRNWIKCPFTLEKHENDALRKFIELHGVDIEKSEFGWFFSTYWLRDSQYSQNEINSLLKLVDEMEENKKLGIHIIPLSDVKNNPKGRCIDCFEFIPINENLKHCLCEQKKGYMTMNAFRKLACKEYRELINPEFHDHLLTQDYKVKDILKAMKTARKHLPEQVYETPDGQLTLDVLTRDILAGIKWK